MQTNDSRFSRLYLSALRLACALIALAAAEAGAQTSVHGIVSGRVADPTSAAVAGATVILTSDDTLSAQTTTTSTDGRYTFVRVSPGRYVVEVEQAGFPKARHDQVVVRVNETAIVHVTLTVGGVQEVITVGSGAEVVQANDASVSLVVDEVRIRELPLNSKDFQRLVYLAPGVAGGTLVNPSSSGTRGSSNNFVIDGLSANEEREVAGLTPPGNSAGDPLPNIISTEAIQEFRVITSNADASFGRGAGAQVNIITKSGGNTAHGSLYEYFRNERFDARDFFNTGPFFRDDGTPKPPPFEQHLFGATTGGPLARDKHFFFVSYEGFRQELQQTASPVLPNAALLDLVPGDLGRVLRGYFYDLGTVPATGHPAGRFQALTQDERGAAIAAGFPAHLFDGDPANGEAGVTVSSRASTRDYDQNALLLRTDHRLGNRSSLSARYVRMGSELRSRFNGMPGTLSIQPRALNQGSLELRHTLTPSQIVEVRAGLLRADWHTENGDVPDSLRGVARTGLNLGLSGMTAFFTPFVEPAIGFDSRQTVPQVSAQHTWDAGQLILRSGLDIRPIRVAFANNALATPTYSFLGLVGRTGLLGAGPSQTESVALSATQTRFDIGAGPNSAMRHYDTLQQDYFIQGDWRLRPDLTINAGLRYSLFGAYAIDNVANFYAAGTDGRPVAGVSPFANGRTMNLIATPGGGLPLYRGDRNNLQPRVGAAWNIGAAGVTVLRAAWGLYHDRLFQFGFANLVNNTPYAISGTAGNVPFVMGEPVPINPNVPNLFGIDPGIVNPYFHRFNVAVERQLDRHTSVTASYVGSRGRELARIIDVNFAPAFPQASRPDARFATQRFLTNAGSSTYDALQLYLERRLSRGVSLTAAYTYADFRDVDNPDTIGATTVMFPTLVNSGASAAAGIQVGPFVPRPIEADYGTSSAAVPHNLAVSHVLELPFGRERRFMRNAGGLLDGLAGGWSLAGILRARSGNAVNLTLGQDVNDDGANNDRPALLSGALSELYDGGGEKTQYLVAQGDARARLGTPADVTDPFAVVPRNALRGPALWAYDLSLSKRVRLGSRMGLQVEANIFNLFNRTNLNVPNTTLSSALFGRITSTAAGFGPRQMQFGAKLTF